MSSRGLRGTGAPLARRQVGKERIFSESQRGAQRLQRTRPLLEHSPPLALPSAARGSVRGPGASRAETCPPNHLRGLNKKKGTRTVSASMTTRLSLLWSRLRRARAASGPFLREAVCEARLKAFPDAAAPPAGNVRGDRLRARRRVHVDEIHELHVHPPVGSHQELIRPLRTGKASGIKQKASSRCDECGRRVFSPHPVDEACRGSRLLLPEERALEHPRQGLHGEGLLRAESLAVECATRGRARRRGDRARRVPCVVFSEARRGVMPGREATQATRSDTIFRSREHHRRAIRAFSGAGARLP